jgi:hypothetical protein
MEGRATSDDRGENPTPPSILRLCTPSKPCDPAPCSSHLRPLVRACPLFARAPCTDALALGEVGEEELPRLGEEVLAGQLLQGSPAADGPAQTAVPAQPHDEDVAPRVRRAPRARPTLCLARAWRPNKLLRSLFSAAFSASS